MTDANESAKEEAIKIPDVLPVLPLKDLAGEPTGSALVLGQVVGVHIDPAFLKDGLFDITAARTIARCGYRGDYAAVKRVFEMLRPSS